MYAASTTAFRRAALHVLRGAAGLGAAGGGGFGGAGMGASPLSSLVRRTSYHFGRQSSYNGLMSLLHPPAEDLQISSVLHALSDPQRLRIVRSLAEDPAPRRCGGFDLCVTKSTLTHHFRVLREAGVIDQREEGTARLNRLRREDLDGRFPGLLDAVLSAAADPHGALT
jgi:DNA-binding transcriptional ArsR family regulator